MNDRLKELRNEAGVRFVMVFVGMGIIAVFIVSAVAARDSAISWVLGVATALALIMWLANARGLMLCHMVHSQELHHPGSTIQQEDESQAKAENSS